MIYDDNVCQRVHMYVCSESVCKYIYIYVYSMFLRFWLSAHALRVYLYHLYLHKCMCVCACVINMYGLQYYTLEYSGGHHFAVH